MTKSSCVVYTLIAMASAVLLCLWYALGFHYIDSPTDLVVSIVWWALIALLVVLTVRAEREREAACRTIYIARDGRSLFNPEHGLVEVSGRTPMDVMTVLLQGMDYGFGRKEFPDASDFTPGFLVRTRSFEADGDASGVHGAEGRDLDHLTWAGEVVVPREGETSAAMTFRNAHELEAILSRLSGVAVDGGVGLA